MHFLVNVTEHDDINKSGEKARKESLKAIQNKKAAKDKGKKWLHTRPHIDPTLGQLSSS